MCHVPFHKLHCYPGDIKIGANDIEKQNLQKYEIWQSGKGF